MPILNIVVIDAKIEKTAIRLVEFVAFLLRIILSFAVIFVATSTVNAQDASLPDIISGPAAVVDADIIRIGNQRVILWGIDAPERGQSCYKDGKIWGCRDAAMRRLETLSGRGEITCYLTGVPDPFSRRFGVCEAGGEDINSEMVRFGMALALLEQTDDYEDIQMEAILAEVGLWQIGVEFEEPWVFRQMNTPGGYR